MPITEHEGDLVVENTEAYLKTSKTSFQGEIVYGIMYIAKLVPHISALALYS
jgi:hypothetical protein